MPNVVLSSYTASRLEDLLRLWRESFEYGVGVTDPHPLEEQRTFFLSEVLPKNSVRLALQAGSLVGFVAATPESISQLYVRVSCHAQGIGSLLLHWARSSPPGAFGCTRLRETPMPGGSTKGAVSRRSLRASSQRGSLRT
jgi:hypothetical protein